MSSPVHGFSVTSFDIGQGPNVPDPAIMNSGRVPVGVYVDPESFAREASLLGRIWLNIADACDVPNPGDWIVRDIACRNASVLITRDRGGTLRAFHNICQHRGMQLVWGRSGSGSGGGASFVCPYHAWSYGADGALRSVPDADCFPGLDRGDAGLTPIAIGEWQGFIYVNLDPAPAQTLDEFMAPVTAHFHDLPFGNFPRHATIRARLPCNWKLLLEAQSESYHIRALHARTVSGMLSSSENPFCHPLYWESLGQHRTWSTAINPGFQLSDARPVQKFAFMASAQIVSTADAPGTEAAPPSGFSGRAAIDRGDDTIWAADNLIVFPNVQLNAGGNGCWMHRFWPVSANETDWEARYYYAAPTSLRHEFAQHYTTAFNRDTLTEDNNACSRQQSVMRSGGIDAIRFGLQEMPCLHSAAVVAAAVKCLDDVAQAAE